MENKLLQIQTELRAPKDLNNDFAHYKYRSCESILEALKPLLKSYNCLLTITDDMVMFGNRFYVKASVCLHDIEAKAMYSATAFAREEEVKKGMDSAQITGAASSYARKYALNGLFLIDDTKDADFQNNAEHKAETRPATPQEKHTAAGTATKQDGPKTAIGLIMDRKGPNTGGYVQYAIKGYFKENGKPMYFSTKIPMDIETLDEHRSAGTQAGVEYADNENPNFAANITGLMAAPEDVPF